MKWLFPLTFLAMSMLAPWTLASPPDTAGSKPAAGQSAATSSAKSAHTRGRYAKGKRSARKAGPSYQLHPDAQRYQEIQKSLADRGYFKGEVNGQWGDDSIDALKRFQADQKLPDDGKINSLSLIGLGLGPKHNGSAVTLANGTAAPVAEPPPAPVTEPVTPSTSDDPPR
jgi:hypothetical protein